MNKRMATNISIVLGTIGVVLMLAGPAFQLLPSNLSIFAGVVCFIVGGAILGLALRGGEEKE